MTQIEQIKAEIERLIECVGKASRELKNFTPYMDGQLIAYEDILTFIDSLDKKPVVDEGKDEIDECFTKMMLKESTPKIKVWVARHKSGDLGFFSKHPIRGNELWYCPNLYIGFCLAEKELMSELKWEDEPIEVELSIRKI